MDFQHCIIKTYLLFSIQAPHATMLFPHCILPSGVVSPFIKLAERFQCRALQMFPLIGGLPSLDAPVNRPYYHLSITGMRNGFNWMYFARSNRRNHKETSLTCPAETLASRREWQVLLCSFIFTCEVRRMMKTADSAAPEKKNLSTQGWLGRTVQCFC